MRPFLTWNEGEPIDLWKGGALNSLIVIGDSQKIQPMRFGVSAEVFEAEDAIRILAVQVRISTQPTPLFGCEGDR